MSEFIDINDKSKPKVELSSYEYDQLINNNYKAKYGTDMLYVENQVDSDGTVINGIVMDDNHRQREELQKLLYPSNVRPKLEELSNNAKTKYEKDFLFIENKVLPDGTVKPLVVINDNYGQEERKYDRAQKAKRPMFY